MLKMQTSTKVFIISVTISVCMYEKCVQLDATTEGFSLKTFEEDVRGLVVDTADAWNITRPFIFNYLGIKMKSLFLPKYGDSAAYRQIGFQSLRREEQMSQYFSKYPLDGNGIYVIIDKSHLANVIQQISQRRFPAHIFKWILLCHGCDSDDIQSDIRLLNGIIILITSSSAPYGDVRSFRLIEVQSHRFSDFLHKINLGFWDRNRGVAIDAHPTFGIDGPLNGVPLKVHFLTTGKGEHDLLFGRNLLKILQSDLNFTILEYVGLKHSYGSRLENGSFSGVIGEFINDDSMDILAHDIVMTDDRYAVLDFSSPIHYTHLGILHKKPKRFHDTSILIYASPFSTAVWFLILATCFVFATALKLFSLAENVRNSSSDAKDLQSANADVCFTILSMMTGQGGDEFLSRTSSSVLITTFGMFSMIVAVSYSAVLSSHFTVMRPTVIVEDIDRLILRWDYQMGMSETILETFKGQPNLKYIESLLSKDRRNIIKPGELGKAINRIFKEKFVLVESSHVLNLVPDVCSVSFVRLPNAKLYTRHWAFQKNSPYRHIISKTINKMKSAGVISHLEDHFFKTDRSLKHCHEDDSDIPPQLELQQVYALFGIILLGILLAIIYLFIEKVATMCFKKSNNIWLA